MLFQSTALTHVGKVRELNEDAFTERPNIGVWAIADGMGGHAAGEVASQAIIQAIKDLPGNGSFEETLQSVHDCLQLTNQQLLSHSNEYANRRIPGSTVVVLVLSGSQGAVVWVGDSRIYRYANQHLSRLTRDHSHVQDLVDQGLIQPQEAESHPMSNVITRAVGIGGQLDVDSCLIEVQPDDQFLLCSDGLNRMVSDSEIAAQMAAKDNTAIAASLMDMALERGATDNVTIICCAQGGAADGFLS